MTPPENSPNHELVQIPQIGLIRSMNRSGLLLAACGLGLDREFQDLIRAKAERTAIYCAADQSTSDHAELLQYIAAPDENKATAYAKLIPPKWGLQASIGLVAASLSIILGIEGGTHTFHDFRFGSEHALNQAKLDLDLGVIDLALVAAVASAEDPLMQEKYKKAAPGRSFSEGAGLLLLSAGHDEISFTNSKSKFYGIATPLIHYIQDVRRA